MTEPTIVDDLRVGDVIADRYRIHRVLGRGGMGVVYEGEHTTVGRPIALKVLSREWAEHPGVSTRFRAEARAASAAGHPNIIQVLDAGELDDGRPYLVMELVRGRDLFDEIQARGQIELARACAIGVGIARALDAAHERGIIHRDLKPENVMLAKHGDQETVKVLDFGIAADTTAERRPTAAGQVLGTPATMAPEQASGQPATIAFDIYALGVILFQMLSGREPFEDANQNMLLLAKVDGDAPSVSTLRQGIPAPLVELVDLCLARDPHARPQSAAEVARRLEQIRKGLLRTSTPAPAPTIPESLPVVSARRRSPLPWVLLTAAVTATVSAGAWWWMTAGQQRAPEPIPAAIEAGSTGGAPAAGSGAVAAATTGGGDGSSDDGSSGGGSSGGGSSGGDTTGATDSGSDEVAVAADDDGSTPSRPRPRPRPQPPQPKPDDGGSSVTPPPSGSDCYRMRKQARQSREEHAWSAVLQHTSQRSCWKAEGGERLRLRTKAFMELGRWDDCIATGSRISGSEPESWVRTCRKRKDMDKG